MNEVIRMNQHRPCALKVRSAIPLAALAMFALTAMAPNRARAASGHAKVVHESAIPAAKIPAYITAAIDSPDRPAADRKLDESRKPAQVMAFFGVKPGMRVADLWAGGGYTTELLARIVGPSGKVYSQNGPFPEKFKKNETLWQSRLKEPGMSNVVEVTKPFGSPDLLPVAPGSLDMVFINMNYHDLFNIGADPAALNATVFKALKPGGIYAIVDNSAKPGAGTSETKTLHRIDEATLIKQVEAAGFRLAATSNVLRNPNDPRTQPFWKMNHTQDRFVLKFVKP
jgi:predicted methyltransferase